MRTSKKIGHDDEHQGHHRVTSRAPHTLFPDPGTAVESLITRTRTSIIQGSDDRLLVMVGLIHDPACGVRPPPCEQRKKYGTLES
jgi:hypothetical protein